MKCLQLVSRRSVILVAAAAAGLGLCTWRLAHALAETLADAEIRSKLIAAGLEPSYATGDAVLAQIEDELPRMRAIAQRAQIRAD
eukprot:gene8457-8547_t